MHPSFPTSAGVVLQHGSHFYLLHRSEKSRHWPLYWGFPGGKQEEGETLFATARRELLEETGVHIEDIDVVREVMIEAEYIDGVRRFALFLCRTWIGSPENLETKLHKDGGWYRIEEFPHPVLPHIRAGFDALMRQETTLFYDGRGDIFE